MIYGPINTTELPAPSVIEDGNSIAHGELGSIDCVGVQQTVMGGGAGGVLIKSRIVKWT